jgi:hypothetical protein
MGILIKNNIVNQKGTPAFYESSLATRPVANIQGRMFIDTDIPSTGIYRDNGTSWDQVADSGAGTTGTLQQVTTNGSSTNVGISVSTNGIGIGTTIPGINRLDIHTGSGINATFNGTGTTNSALQFQLAGAGKWNIGNLYNSAANDFIITDVVNSLNRITVKNTGQTFIGSDTTSSGALVVNNATSDNHIVVLGANGPSVRIRNAGTAPTLNVGFGISTAANNFIQGSVSGNYCIFNSSTTASPILFGIYNSGAGQTQEAARISSTQNFLVGSVTDTGQKLQITGTAKVTGITTLGSRVNINGAGDNPNWALNVLNFSNFSDGTQGLIIGAYTGGSGFGAIYADTLTPNGSNAALIAGSTSTFLNANTGGTVNLSIGTTTALTIASTGNVLIGTTTDNGQKLQINGNLWATGTSQSYIAGNVGIGALTANYKLTTDGSGNAFMFAALSTNIGTVGNWIGYLYGYTGSTYQKGATIFESQDSNGRGFFYIALNNAANSSNVTIADAKFTVKYTGVVNIPITQTYATNALALAGGLVTGDIYKNSVGVLSIVY